MIVHIYINDDYGSFPSKILTLNNIPTKGDYVVIDDLEAKKVEKVIWRLDTKFLGSHRVDVHIK